MARDGRRAIVHIGAPRTGTTALQSLLDRHRDALASRGILYPALVPASAPRPHLNHQHLGETLDGRRPRAERRELLDGLARGLRATEADVVLLSYERLCRLPWWSGAPATLARLFRRHGFAMEILLTLRPQAGAIQSQYVWRCQFLREGRSLRDAFARDLSGRWLDPMAGVGRWIAAADGRCTAVPLRDARAATPLASRIAEALGLGGRLGTLLTPADLARVENGRLDAAVVEVSRRLRATGVRIPDKPAARRVVDAIEEAVRARGLAAPFQGLDPTMVAAAEARFARANERFARRVWDEPWAARVAPDRPGPITEIVARPVPLPPEAEAALAEIAAATRAAFGLGAARGADLRARPRRFWPS